MLHGITMLLKVIPKRLNKVGLFDKEVGEIQLGFRKKTGTKEAIFAQKMLGGRCLQMQREVYLCFIEHKKAFDKVQHEGIMRTLNKHILEKEYIQLIKSLY